MEASQIAPEAKARIRDDRHVAQFSQEMEISEEFVLFAAQLLVDVRRSIEMRDLAGHVDQSLSVTLSSLNDDAFVVGGEKDLTRGEAGVDEGKDRLADVPTSGKIFIVGNGRILPCSDLSTDDGVAAARPSRFELVDLVFDRSDGSKENLVEQGKQGFQFDVVLGHDAVGFELLSQMNIVRQLIEIISIGRPVNHVFGPDAIDGFVVRQDVRDIAENLSSRVSSGDQHLPSEIESSTMCQRIDDDQTVDRLSPVVEIRSENVRQIARMSDFNAKVSVENQR